MRRLKGSLREYEGAGLGAGPVAVVGVIVRTRSMGSSEMGGAGKSAYWDGGPVYSPPKRRGGLAELWVGVAKDVDS